MTTTDLAALMSDLQDMGILCLVSNGSGEEHTKFMVVLGNEVIRTNNPVDVVWERWHREKTKTPGKMPDYK